MTVTDDGRPRIRHLGFYEAATSYQPPPQDSKYRSSSLDDWCSTLGESSSRSIHCRMLMDALNKDAKWMCLSPSPPFKVLDVSEALAKRAGYTDTEMIGKPPTLLEGRDTDQDTEIGNAMRAGGCFDGVVSSYTKQGTTFTSNLRLRPVLHPQHGTIEYLVMIYEETNRQIYEETTPQSECAGNGEASDVVESANLFTETRLFGLTRLIAHLSCCAAILGLSSTAANWSGGNSMALAMAWIFHFAASCLSEWLCQRDVVNADMALLLIGLSNICVGTCYDYVTNYSYTNTFASISCLMCSLLGLVGSRSSCIAATGTYCVVTVALGICWGWELVPHTSYSLSSKSPRLIFWSRSIVPCLTAIVGAVCMVHMNKLLYTSEQSRIDAETKLTKLSKSYQALESRFNQSEKTLLPL